MWIKETFDSFNDDDGGQQCKSKTFKQLVSEFITKSEMINLKLFIGAKAKESNVTLGSVFPRIPFGNLQRRDTCSWGTGGLVCGQRFLQLKKSKKQTKKKNCLIAISH